MTSKVFRSKFIMTFVSVSIYGGFFAMKSTKKSAYFFWLIIILLLTAATGCQQKEYSYKELNSSDPEQIIENATIIINTDTNPENLEEALLTRAEAYITLMKDEKAEKDIRQLIDLNTKKITPYIILAELLSEHERDEESYKIIAKIFQLTDNIEEEQYFKDESGNLIVDKMAEFYIQAGKIAHDYGQYQESINYFTRVLELKPNPNKTQNALIERGLSYYKAKEFEKAKADALQWLAQRKMDLDHPEEYEELSDAYLMAEEYDKALEAIDTALKKAPWDYGYFINRGRINIAKGDFAAARNDFAVVYEKKSAPGGPWDFLELNRLEMLLEEKEKETKVSFQ